MHDLFEFVRHCNKKHILLFFLLTINAEICFSFLLTIAGTLLIEMFQETEIYIAGIKVSL